MSRLAMMGLVCLASISSAAEFTADPTDYLSKLQKLKPGDELLLAPGVYHAGLPLHRLMGTAEQPVVIRSSRPGGARFIASARRNTVSIVDSAHIHVSDLLLDGAGQPADAVRAEGYARFAHHITLENLLIVNHGLGQAFVGISTKCPAWGWVIRGNRIIGAGTGMYLGNSDGRAPFVAGVIEHNLIVASTGYNLQIKHQAVRPDLPGLPQAASRTLIRHNVLIKGANSSRGKDARPSLLVGHWPLQGAGKDDVYEIYGNFFYQNPGEALFQGEGNLAFYNNLLVNDFGDALNIQPHNDVPRKIYLFHNTLLARESGIRIRTGLSEPEALHVVANAVYAAQPLTGVEPVHNLIAARKDARSYLKAPDVRLDRLSLEPQAGRLQMATANFNWMSQFTDAECDFDGRRLGFAYYGAYAKPALWQLKPDIKPAMRQH